MTCVRGISKRSHSVRNDKWCAHCILGTTLIALLVFPHRVFADDNHYQNYLLGERAVGLGGAFTAISDDSSGAFYNPAGLAETPHSSLSLSAAMYGFSSRSSSINTSSPIEGNDSTFISYPTTTAWIQRVRKGNEDGSGRIQLAVSLFTPYSDVWRTRWAYSMGLPSPAPNRERKLDVVEVTLAEDDTIWLGASFAWKIWKWVSIGATVFGTLRTGVYHFHGLYIRSLWTDGVIDDALTLARRTELKFRHWGLLGVVGLQFRITEELRLGLSFRTPQYAISGTGDLNVLTMNGELDPQPELQIESIGLDATFQERQPFKATLGVAYLRPRDFGLSLDFSVYGTTSQYPVLKFTYEGKQEELFPTKKKVTIQVNWGGEYYLWERVPLRLGFFTNLSSLDPVTTCTILDPDCVGASPFEDGMDRFGLSGAIGYEFDHATLNLGVSYNIGFDSAKSIQNFELDTRRSFLFLMIGGSFRF
ncbi:MAG: hypothetical protein V1754_11635 [Pseudomonadota bacterium]